MFIDTHTHIYIEKFDKDRDACIHAALDAGVTKLYMPNIDSTYIKAMRETHEAYPDVCIPMMGLHPCSVANHYKEELTIIREELLSHSYAAVGEVGLDYYWSREFEKEQQYAFLQQIKWANEMHLPLIIHSRDSLDDCISMVKENKADTLSGIFHCFSGTVEQAEAIISLGFYIGIGGVVTFKNSGLGEVVKHIPIDKIILETDAPYLAPHPFRGKRNEPKYLPIIAEKIAALHQLPIQDLAKITTKTAESIFLKH